MKEAILKYHFDNLYGMESDCKIHEQYWYEYYSKLDEQELKEIYKDLMLKAGSWNSNQIGCMNATVRLLNEKFTNWRNN